MNTKEQFDMLSIQYPEHEEELSAIYNDIEHKKQKNEK